ncbi:WSC-domain-containing protein [Trametes polyzona]|nr:WSC-domain-containing protein [Trametes polyzona]
MLVHKLPVVSLLVASGPLSALSFGTPDIPLNWTTVYPCAVDFGSRVIVDDITVQDPNNTPASCIERCDAQNYVYAGVEFSNECHCGTGLKSTPESAPLSDCNMACSGDADLSCGGSFRIQIYKSPALPAGGYQLQGCFVDTPPSSPALAAPVEHHAFATNLALIDQCTAFCQHRGYPYAGVEDGADCQCSAGLAPGAVRADEAECSTLCPLPPGEGEEFCGGVQRLMVYSYVPARVRPRGAG